MNRYPRLLGALALALFPLVASALAQDEALDDFKKAFPRFKERAERIEAVRTLELATSVGAVDTLCGLMKDRDREVARAAAHTLAKISTAPVRERLPVLLEEEKDALVLSGVLEAVELSKLGAAAPQVRACLAHKDAGVRVHAAAASAALGDAEAVPELLTALQDREGAVRIAALDALGDLGDAAGAEAVALALGDTDWHVQASAIQAAAKLRHKSAVGPLIGLLRHEGRLAADAMQALIAITGDDYDRAEAWERWWERVGERWEPPTAAELAKRAEARKASAARYGPVREDGTNYHGIETPSKRILFIIDISGSMEDLVVDRAAFEGRGYRDYTKMTIVKAELVRTIENLGPNVFFNILAFASEVEEWKKGLKQANVVNRSNAIKWVEKLSPIGGAAAQGLASALGGGDLSAGRTNTYLALTTGLEVAGRGARDSAYATEVDTIFFLSDGRPTCGEFVETQEIVDRVSELNKLRKVVLHVIAIGQFHKDFLRDLASRNGGAFIDLGK